MKPPALNARHALFLDIDGTLIDLAPTPDGVIVPDGLRESLHPLREFLGGALAILSGRKLSDIDRLIGPDFACAAEHGAIMRDSSGTVTLIAHRLAAYDSWLKTLKQYESAMPGVLIEEKEFSLVIHYRRAPQHEAELGKLAEQLVGNSTDGALMLAHCAFELKPRGGDKGDALARFMALPPFASRLPVFIGDDVTDDPAIRMAASLGAQGFMWHGISAEAPQRYDNGLKHDCGHPRKAG